VDRSGRNEDERARTYFLHGISVGVEGVAPFEHVERLRLVVRVRRVFKAGVLRCLADSPVSARFGAGSLPCHVRAVRPHGQDHGIAIAMRSEDNLWPLLLHHLPFGASPEKPTVLTRVQADAALFLPRPRRSHEEVEGESHEVKEEQTADDLTADLFGSASSLADALSVRDADD